MDLSEVPLAFSNPDTLAFWHNLPEGEFVRLRQEALEQAIESAPRPEPLRALLRDINLQNECLRDKSPLVRALRAFECMREQVLDEGGNIDRTSELFAQISNKLTGMASRLEKCLAEQPSDISKES